VCIHPMIHPMVLAAVRTYAVDAHRPQQQCAHRAFVRQVVLCRDMITPSQIPNTLTHELIHAYDHCTGKGFSLTNCEHHACTEVRSPSPSGRR